MSESVKRYSLRQNMPATAITFLPDVVVSASNYDAISARLAELEREHQETLLDWGQVRLELAEAKRKGAALAVELAAVEAELNQTQADPMVVALELATLKAGAGEPVGIFTGEFGPREAGDLWFAVKGDHVRMKINAIAALPAVGATVYTTPQPTQDVSGLVSALDAADDYLNESGLNQICSGSYIHLKISEALAKFEKGGDV
ncbi:hypothetical protein [Pseudomonas sp. TMP25]|uniref:hypothetical protein n=1 Tax=Pseudomonas sp. TMP25 TaxID=3136561 RepID=UPI003100D46E